MAKPTVTHPRGLTRKTHHRGSPSGLTPRTHSGDLTTGAHKGDSPRSVLGPASRCLNLSSREASLSLKAELLRALGSGAPPSATVAACGRDRDLCRGTASLPLPVGGGGRREVRSRGSAHSQVPTRRPGARPLQSRPTLTEQRRAACSRQRGSRLPRRAHCPPGHSSGKQTRHEGQNREEQKTTAHVGVGSQGSPEGPPGRHARGSVGAGLGQRACMGHSGLRTQGGYQGPRQGHRDLLNIPRLPPAQEGGQAGTSTQRKQRKPSAHTGGLRGRRSAPSR